MRVFNKKCLNILIVVFSFLLIVLVLIGGSFAIHYYILYDGYFWLVENPSVLFFMSFMGLSLLLCLIENGYSFYVSDQLALFFNRKDPLVEFSEHMSTFLVKILKCIVIISLLIVFSFALYDLLTIEPLFYSRGILKSLQVGKK